MKTALLRKPETHSQKQLFSNSFKKSSSSYFFQPKLKIGAANDSFEKEADSVAAKVVNGKQTNVAQKSGISNLQAYFFSGSIQEKEEITQLQSNKEEEEEELQPKLLKESVQKQPIEEGEEEESALQTKVQLKCSCEKEKENAQLKRNTNSLTTQTDAISENLQQSRGGGSPLSISEKTKMEAGFGVDFSNVKIHTDQRAVQMSQNLSAKAFTSGNDIYFNKGQFNPNSKNGQLLLAHELTHTLQQGASGQQKVNLSPIIQRKKIEYQTLSWAHFKGKASKNAKYDAMVSSNMHNPKMNKIKPKTATYTTKNENCGKDDKEKTFVAKLEYDTDAIKVKSFFNEKKSKKKKWLTNSKARSKKCKTMFVKKCEASFKKAKKKARKTANKEVKKCKKNKVFKKGGHLIYTFGEKDIKISSAKKCRTILKPAMITNIMSKESWEGNDNLGTTMEATTKAECKSVVAPKCLSDAMPKMSASLLKHEQGHFDLTQLIAEETEKLLKDKADNLAVTAEGCGKKKANKNVKKELKKQKPKKEFNKIWKDAKKKLNKSQKTYDTETNHSMKTEKQEEWNQKFKDDIVNKAEVILPKPKVVKGTKK